jgi:sugar phosphate isomerase/epimerase
MKFACADFTFPLLTHAQSLQLIGLIGFDGVDIGLFEGRSHLWPSREFANTASSARLLKQKLDDLGLLAADVYLQMNPDFIPFAINHPEVERREKAREWFLRSLDFACALECRHLTTLPGVHFENEATEESFKRSVAELHWRVEQAQKHGVIFGVEAHVGSIVSDPASAEKLVRAVTGLTLTLDYTHFTRLGMSDALVDPLVKYASHFHVRGAREGRLQTSFADNTINYKQVWRALQAADYKGWLGIEYIYIDWEHCNESDNLSETILFRDHMKELIGGMVVCHE